MTFEELDRDLSSWNQRLAAIADSLLELQSDPTYRVLTGAGGTEAQELTGRTAQRVLPALKSIEGIFHQFSLLQAIVDRASKLREDLPVFGREQALRKIEGLLLGPSIQLPADSLSLSERTLLNGTPAMIRPEQLLASMAKSFSEARDAVLLVSSAWDDLAREVDPIETQLRGVEAMASGAGCALPKTLAEAQAVLAIIKSQVSGDPLTACERLRTGLVPALRNAAGQLEAQLALAGQTQAAHDLLARLQGVEREIQAATAVSHVKILGCGPPSSPAGLRSEDLNAWLARLQQRSSEERPETLAHGLENWHKAAAKALETCTQALHQERLPLETRGELRGRLDALKAKARAYGLAEDTSIAGLALQAEELLYSQPTDLVRSAVAVEAYERRLTGPARAQQQGGPRSNGDRR